MRAFRLCVAGRSVEADGVAEPATDAEDKYCARRFQRSRVRNIATRDSPRNSLPARVPESPPSGSDA